MRAGVPAAQTWCAARAWGRSLACLLAATATWLEPSSARAQAVAEDEVAAEAEVPGKRSVSPCPELEGPDAAQLDSFRTGVERSVCLTAWYFDSLFGVLPENEIVETRRTHGRLRGGVTWDERDGFGQDLSLRAQVQMPLARKRLMAVFGRDTDEAFIEGGSGEFDGVAFTEEEEDRSWLFGIGHQPLRGTRSRLGLSAGVRLRTPPDPFVQASYWFQDRLGEQLLFRGRQTVFWENEDGFGTSTRLTFDRRLDDARLLRWSSYLRVSEATDGMRWNTNLTLFKALSVSRAVALRGSIRGETGREVNPIEYKALLIHRRRIFREWLFLELQGGGGWIREEISEPREFVPEAAVILEMSFGRHPRERAAAVEADIER